MITGKLAYLKIIGLFLFTLTMFGTVATAQFNEIKEQDSLRGDLLIINSFDAQAMEARRNKKALFGGLADSLKHMLRLQLNSKKSKEIIVVAEFINNPSSNDSIYIDLINKYSALHAIVIKDVKAYFEQTGVEVTKEPDGKSRVASYNINADVTYLLYNKAGKIKETKTKVFEYFTERTVLSGLFAAGPDIIANRKHAFEIVQKNAEQFLREIKYFLEDD